MEWLKAEGPLALQILDSCTEQAMYGVQTSETRSKIRTWIVGLTAVVVVLPALINGGIDVYRSILNIPRTDAERTKPPPTKVGGLPRAIRAVSE